METTENHPSVDEMPNSGVRGENMYPHEWLDYCSYPSTPAPSLNTRGTGPLALKTDDPFSLDYYSINKPLIQLCMFGSPRGRV